MTYQEIKYIFEIIPLHRSNVCWVSCQWIYTHMHSFKLHCSLTSVIFLISQKVISLTHAVELFTYQTNPNISRLKTRYATAVKTNFFITSQKFLKRVSFKHTFFISYTSFKPQPKRPYFYSIIIYPITIQLYYLDTCLS